MRMRTTFALVAAVLAASLLHALAGAHEKGQVGGSGDWPAGLRELANGDASLGGYFVNASDWVFFTGDARAASRFLEEYAKLRDTPLRVEIRFGDRPAPDRFGPGERYDWMLAIQRRGWGAPEAGPGETGNYVITVTLWLSDRIDPDELWLFGDIAPLAVPAARR